MGKESLENWPQIDTQDTAVIPDGFSPEPDPNQYLVTKQETTPAEVRASVEPDPVKVDRLLGNVAPKIEDPNQVGNIYAEEGKQSIRPIATSDYEVSNKIPNNFLEPAPVREPRVQKSWVKRLFGG